jgi:hypothetical protein
MKIPLVLKYSRLASHYINIKNKKLAVILICNKMSK